MKFSLNNPNTSFRDESFEHYCQAYVKSTYIFNNLKFQQITIYYNVNNVLRFVVKGISFDLIQNSCQRNRDSILLADIKLLRQLGCGQMVVKR